MSSWGGQNDRDRVLDATDLAQLIGEHIPLKPAGREMVGICPFHEDSRPSLHVVTHKGNAFYKCFACGAAGNAIGFVMAYHRKSFPEALQFLADRAGITLSPRKPRHPGRPHSAGDSATGAEEQYGRGGMPQASREDLREANRIALQFFQAVLASQREGARFRKLIEERGISQEMVSQFKIGASPDSWDHFTRRLDERGMNRQPFVAAGLLKQRQAEERCYDAFRNRLIFPICDEFGTPIAFGGRRINPDDEPKYLNSAESAVFDKSSTLFGLDLAKRSIIDTRRAIVAEGYTDVIACHQAGITNVVGTLGTALTGKHARFLSRLCDTVVLVFDGDEAGQRAAERGLAAFFDAPVDVKICTLPDDQDPDEMLRQPGGTERLMSVLDAGIDALMFRIERFQSQIATIESVSGKQKHLDSFMQELGSLGFGSLQGIRRRHAVAMLSERLGLPMAELESTLAKYRQRRPSMAGESGVSGPQPGAADGVGGPDSAAEIWDSPIGVTRARRLAELEVLSITIFEPPPNADHLRITDNAGTARPLLATDFHDPVARRIAEMVLPDLKAGHPRSMQSLLDDCQDEGLSREIGHLYFKGRARYEAAQDDAAEALTIALDALSSCIRRDDYRRSTVRGGVPPQGMEQQIQAVSEALERRREQADLPTAIAQNV